MTFRRDHAAGLALLALAGAAFAAGRDLALGTPASPGAGLLPGIAAALVALLGLALLLRARASPPLADAGWADAMHAATIAAVAAAAVLLYERAGFVVTVAALLFVLLAVVERVAVLRALAFSLGAAGLAWLLFGRLLKSPLPVGPWGF